MDVGDRRQDKCVLGTEQLRQPLEAHAAAAGKNDTFDIQGLRQAALENRFREERRPLPAIALTADSSAVTAIVNDYGAEELFARQVQAYGRRGDVLVALSTSGTSPNIIAAAKAGLDLGVTVWALTGPAPNPLAALSDSAITVDAPTVATVQEIHLCLVHALCIALDESLQAPAW